MTEKGTKPAPPPAALTDEAVAAYLRRNPDFFRDCPELLASLVPDAVRRADGAIDFQHFLVDKLRGDLETLRAQQGDLLGTSRANLKDAELDAKVMEQQYRDDLIPEINYLKTKARVENEKRLLEINQKRWTMFREVTYPAQLADAEASLKQVESEGIG